MTKEEVTTKVVDILSDIINYESFDIHLIDRLIYDLGLDSLDVVEFIMKLETEFLISIPDSDFDEIKDITVEQIIDSIYNKLNK